MNIISLTEKPWVDVSDIVTLSTWYDIALLALSGVLTLTLATLVPPLLEKYRASKPLYAVTLALLAPLVYLTLSSIDVEPDFIKLCEASQEIANRLSEEYNMDIASSTCSITGGSSKVHDKYDTEVSVGYHSTKVRLVEKTETD